VRITTSAGQTRFSEALLEGDSVVVAFTDSTAVRLPVDSILTTEREYLDLISSIGVGLIVITGWICIYPGC